MKLKYVRLQQYDQIIIFPETLQHSTFKNLNPISAGFCHVNTSRKMVDCYGESTSLMLSSAKDDTYLATKQVFGIDRALELRSITSNL